MTRFLLTNNPWSFQYELHARRDHGPNHIAIPTGAKWEVVKIDECGLPRGDATKLEPLITIDQRDEGLQDLMDQLWNLGIRPKDIGTAGHLAATQKHLNDMRAIVEKGLELKLPA